LQWPDCIAVRPMFIPHQPLPIRAVRYFVGPRKAGTLPAWALSTAGADRARPEAMEPLRKVRRLIDIIISPFSF